MGFPETSSPSQSGSRRLFISDAHLAHLRPEPHESERSVRLRRFLSTLRGDDVSDLYVLGDLFDLWFEYRSVIFSASFPVLQAFAALSERGVRSHYIVGNHDYWAGPFLENAIGFTVYKEPVVAEMDGMRMLLCHGDGLNHLDYGYRLFKRVARWKPTIALFRCIHPDLAAKLGGMISGLSRQFVNVETAGRLREAAAIRRHALERLRNHDIDVFVAGHSHIPVDESIEVEGRVKRYINLGDWLTHFTYAELAHGQLSLKIFSGDAETT